MTFCSKCGHDAGPAKFCPNCGTAISEQPPVGTTPQRSFIWDPSPVQIFIGVVVIAALYGFPIVDVGGSSLPLATIVNFSGYLAPAHLLWSFYAAWLFGIIFIISGLFSRAGK